MYKLQLERHNINMSKRKQCGAGVDAILDNSTPKRGKATNTISGKATAAKICVEDVEVEKEEEKEEEDPTQKRYQWRKGISEKAKTLIRQCLHMISDDKKGAHGNDPLQLDIAVLQRFVTFPSKPAFMVVQNGCVDEPLVFKWAKVLGVPCTCITRTTFDAPMRLTLSPQPPKWTIVESIHMFTAFDEDGEEDDPWVNLLYACDCNRDIDPLMRDDPDFATFIDTTAATTHSSIGMENLRRSQEFKDFSAGGYSLKAADYTPLHKAKKPFANDIFYFPCTIVMIDEMKDGDLWFLDNLNE